MNSYEQWKERAHIESQRRNNAFIWGMIVGALLVLGVIRLVDLAVLG